MLFKTNTNVILKCLWGSDHEAFDLSNDMYITKNAPTIHRI
jgi:hypothetical protein